MEGHRVERITEALREELDELIGYEMSDPRVENVSVSEIVLSPDGRKAQVRVHIPAPAAKQKEALKALENARNFIRTELAQRLQMYRLPDIRFEVDVSAEVDHRIDFLMRRIRKGRPRDAQPANGESKPLG